MRIRPSIGTGCLVVASVLSSAASADQVVGTRFDVSEVAHAIRARVDRGHTTLVVRREVSNPGARSDQAIFYLDVPPQSAAVGLRSAGMVDGRIVWFDADLLPAEEAAAKYQELTGLGVSIPKDPALLAWRWQGELQLQVFPVPPSGSKLVEYTLEVPSAYERGKYLLELPALGTGQLPASLRVSAARDGDTVEVNDVPVAPEVAVSANVPLRLGLVPRGMPLAGGTLGQVRLGAERVMVHASIELAPRLGEAPRDAAVALVVDTSRSTWPEVAPSLAALRAYLLSMPNASVQVWTFDRHVQAPFGGALPVRQAMARLSAFEPETRNGSQLDDALRRADAELAASSASVRRIVVVTDLRMRSALTPDRLAGLRLRSGAVLHLATVDTGGFQLVRDDASPWAATPRATGGLLWRASAFEKDDGSARGVFEEWARPMRITHLEVRGAPAGLYVPEELDEGSGLGDFEIAPAAVGRMDVLGELWSRPIQVAVLPTEQQGRLWAALAFGSELLSSLTPDEQLVLAKHGSAVSPVTSYLAIEPGVRPSSDGFEGGGLGLSGIGEGGGGQGFGSGHGALGWAHRRPLDPQAVLDGLARAAWLKCQGGAGEADIAIETTIAEVVDITAVTLRPAPAASLAACLREEAWGWELPSVFAAPFATWTAHARPR